MRCSAIKSIESIQNAGTDGQKNWRRKPPYGIRVSGELSWSRFGNVKWVQYDGNNLRVFNMLGRHAILYLSEEFRQAALAANLQALMNYDYIFPGDVGTASTQFTHLVLTPIEPICFQATELGGHQDSTQMSLTKPKR